MNTNFEDIVKNAETILILSHVNPDGDTVSSMLAFNLMLKQQFGKNSDMLILGQFPEVYDFLPNKDEIKSIEEINLNQTYDLAVAVDIAAKDRMGDALNTFLKAKFTMNFDHHKTNNNYGDFNVINGNASSTGEVLFNFMEQNNYNISKDIGTCIYTSILADTGGFQYENTSGKTFEIASKLVELGVNSSGIYKSCFEQKPKAMVLLNALVVNNAKFIANDKIAYSVIYKSDMKKLNAKDDYTNGIPETLRKISSVEVSFVLKEVDENATKVSLRSKKIDVSTIAEVFGGGGHKFASGCTIKKPVNIAINKLVEEIEKYL